MGRLPDRGPARREPEALLPGAVPLRRLGKLDKADGTPSSSSTPRVGRARSACSRRCPDPAATSTTPWNSSGSRAGARHPRQARPDRASSRLEDRQGAATGNGRSWSTTRGSGASGGRCSPPADIGSTITPMTSSLRRRQRLHRDRTPNGSKRPGDPTLIPPGYVGVVTNRTDNPLTGRDPGHPGQRPPAGDLLPQPRREAGRRRSASASTRRPRRSRPATARPRIEQPAGKDDWARTRTTCPRDRDRVPVQRRLPDPPGLHGDLGHPARPGARCRPPVRHAQGRGAKGDLCRRSARSAGSTAPSEAPSTSWSATPARSSRPTPRRSSSGC